MDVEKEVVGFFKETFKELEGKELDLDRSQNNFENWDSFAHMELVGKIESKFKINLELDEVIELDCPRKFVEIVQKKLGEKCETSSTS